MGGGKNTSAKRIVLIFPSLIYKSGNPPIGLASIAASLREAGHAVKILDTTFDNKLSSLRGACQDFRPDFIGMYVDTLMYNDAIRIIHLLRNLGVPIITGGPHPSVLPETLIPHADVVVIGEGERTILEIVEKYPKLKGIRGIWYKVGERVVKNAPREMIDDLDSLPFPALDLLDMGEYTKVWHYLDFLDVGLRGTNMMASRGCPFNCTFCQPTLDILFGKRIRRRSPKKVAEEIKLRMRQFGIRCFFFHDDTFTSDRGWVEEFCRILKEENLKIFWGCNTRVDTIDRGLMATMHMAGCRKLHIGVESANQRVLDEVYHKGIDIREVKALIEDANRAGISSLCLFMIGAPGETRQEIERTLRFAASLRCQEVSFSITSPFPKTQLYEQLKERGYELKKDFGEYNYYKGRCFVDKQVSINELKWLQKKGLLMFYLHPLRWKYVLRHLFSPSGWRKMAEKAERFLK